ncbi:MAG TPA: hypothetical protein VIO64_07525 [Pseudobacteroides sp.]|uniref:hypothetical protein n=1 Tax=Pseudobacteroides sp. TaxID=1968840 RepID=UPI002F9361BB
MKKYKDIWKAEHNLLLSNNIEIFDSLMSLSVLRSVINFYDENKNLFRKDDPKDLYHITGNITSKIDSSFSSSFAKEYRIVLHNLELTRSKWPFFDYYKICRLFHDKYYDLSQCIKDSKYKMRTTRFDLTPDKFLENPVGNYGAYISLNLYDGILKSVWETKDMVDKFNEITN